MQIQDAPTENDAFKSKDTGEPKDHIDEECPCEYRYPLAYMSKSPKYLEIDLDQYI